MAFMTCPGCNGTIAAQAQACPYCGAAVTGQPPAPAPPLRVPAPASAPVPAACAHSSQALFAAAGCAGAVALLELAGRFGGYRLFEFCGWQLVWMGKLGLLVAAVVIALTQASRAKS